MSKLREILAKLCYKIIRKYIKVESWKSPTHLCIYYTIRIFGEKVSELEFTKLELMERRIL